MFELISICVHYSHMYTYRASPVGRHSFPGHCLHSSISTIKNQSEPRGGRERLHCFSFLKHVSQQLLPSYGKRQLWMNNGLQPRCWCLDTVVEALQRDQSFGCMYSRINASQQWLRNLFIDDYTNIDPSRTIFYPYGMQFLIVNDCYTMFYSLSV